jgi:hypothetical protein
MRVSPVAICVTIFKTLGLFLIGCSTNPDEPSNRIVEDTPPPLVSGVDGGGHEGHDHSDGTCDGHPTKGPHGGHLIELGNEAYHAELLHDEDLHNVTIYLLDSSAEQPMGAPLEEITLQLFRDGDFVQYALKAVAAPTNTSGTASQFEIVDEALCDALCHEDGLKGRLQVTLNGKAYTGTIEHTGHDGHDEDGHAQEDPH